jgi:hypothetical protein
MTAPTIRWFNSLMQGAPAMANAFGDMVAVLDACLNTGFNLKNVTTLTRTGSVANVYISGGHQFQVNQVVRSAAWNQSEYNGDFVVTFADSNNLQFTVSGTPASPATTASTGTIKAAPLDWQIAYTATNKRVYRSLNSSSPKPYLRVDNTQPAGWTTGKIVCAKISAGVAMTDVDTYVGVDYMPYRSDLTSFPDWGWYVWRQSYSGVGFSATFANQSNAGATAAKWTIVGDDRCFYFFVQQLAGNSGTICYAFGDLESYKVGDQYSAFLWAHEAYNLSNAPGTLYEWGLNANVGPRNSNYGGLISNGQLLMKSYIGVGGATSHGKFSLATTTNAGTGVETGSNTGITWPNGPDFSLILHPSYCFENGGHVRGLFPGLYAIHNNVGTNLADQSFISNVTNLSGRTFLAQQLFPSTIVYNDSGVNNGCRLALDLTGPWR